MISVSELAERIREELECGQCREPIGGSPSEDFCSQKCQAIWQAGQVGELPQACPCCHSLVHDREVLYWIAEAQGVSRERVDRLNFVHQAEDLLNPRVNRQYRIGLEAEAMPPYHYIAMPDGEIVRNRWLAMDNLRYSIELEIGMRNRTLIGIEGITGA